MSATAYAVLATNFFPTPATIQAQVVCASGPGVASAARAQAQDADLATRLAALREAAEAAR